MGYLYGSCFKICLVAIKADVPPSKQSILITDGKLTSFDLIDNRLNERDPVDTFFHRKRGNALKAHWTHYSPLFSRTRIAFPASYTDWSLPRLLLLSLNRLVCEIATVYIVASSPNHFFFI